MWPVDQSENRVTGCLIFGFYFFFRGARPAFPEFSAQDKLDAPFVFPTSGDRESFKAHAKAAATPPVGSETRELVGGAMGRRDILRSGEATPCVWQGTSVARV